MSDAPQQAGRRAGTFAESLKAVGWSFFGVRKRAAMEQDAARLNPVHVVIAALVLVALFVAALLFIVDRVVAATPVR